jgi:MFS family permease
MAYIRKDAIHVALLAYVLAAQWVVGLTSLQTPLARQVVGISVPEFGWFQSIWGLGFVAASLAVGWFGLWARRGQSIVFGYGLWALAALALGLSQNFGMLVVAGFWAGFANTIVFVNVSTVMMEHTPNAVIGRTITTRQVVVAIVRVVALLWFGWLADSTSIRASIVVMAIVSLAGNVLVTVRTPQLWRHGVTADAGGYSELLALGRRLREALRIVRTFLTPRADKTFAPAEQAWLDGVTAAIALAGWGALFVRKPVLALGAALLVTSVVVVGLALRLAVRRVGRRGSQHMGP